MTQNHFDKLCKQFELESELEKLDLKRQWDLQRSLFFYVGTPQTVHHIRKQWEASKQKSFDEELAYRLERCEMEIFGAKGKEAARSKIEKEEKKGLRHELGLLFKNTIGRVPKVLERSVAWVNRRMERV